MSRTAKEITPETYITSHEAGALLQSNPSSINKWVKEGRIQAHVTPGGHRRIKAGDLVSFLVEYKMPVPDALVFATIAVEYCDPVETREVKRPKKSARKK